MLMKNKKVIFVYIIIICLIFTGCGNKAKESDVLKFGVLRVEDAIPVFAAENFAFFKDDVAEKLLSFSMMRWAYQSPIKRASNYHVHDFCSKVWSK